MEANNKKVFIDYGRQLDIFNPETFSEMITIIGAGGIGSPAAIVLSKMGCQRITVYDADVIEPHNLPNQFYRLEDVDKQKVVALQEIVGAFSGVELVIRPEFFVAQDLEAGVVICAVDKMDQRKAIWKKVRYNPRVKLFIDARMGGEVARVYAINPVDIDEITYYEGTLYDDTEASDERCTAKAIMYNVFGIAAIIGSLIKKHATGQPTGKEILLDLANLMMTKS